MKPDEFRLLQPLSAHRGGAERRRVEGSCLASFEAALAAYWRALAIPAGAPLAPSGGDIVLRHAAVDFTARGEADDCQLVGLRCRRLGNRSIGFEGCIFGGARAWATASLVCVHADSATRMSRPVPPMLRAAILAFEAGEPMVEVQAGDWLRLGQAASAIRAAVFVAEQGIPAELEWDEADAGCLHALAVNRFGTGVGTGRLLDHSPGVAKIGRMAVQRSLRGQGIGRRLLDALSDAARARGDREVLLHAQLTAESFYRAAGFERRGKAFEEAGLPHVEMVRAL